MNRCPACSRRQPSWSLVLCLVAVIVYLVALLLWALQIRYHV